MHMAESLSRLLFPSHSFPKLPSQWACPHMQLPWVRPRVVNTTRGLLLAASTPSCKVVANPLGSELFRLEKSFETIESRLGTGCSSPVSIPRPTPLR